METTVNELGDSRLELAATIDPKEIEERIQEAARELGKDMKMPGFREGKVPPEMVIQRMGREAVLTQSIENALGEWYERALIDADVSPVGDPKLNIPELPKEGEPLNFSIEIGVLPEAKLGDWKKDLEAPRQEEKVPQEAVDAEIERLREGFARLNPVERAAKTGDVVLIDFEGTIDGEPFEGGEGRDYLLELGSNQVVEGFEEALAGAEAGDEREAEITFPDDYPAEEMRGKTAKFAIKVKEVREKELPELDDDFATEASEFDTLEELRGDIESKIAEILEQRSEEAFREAALDALAKKVEVDLPKEAIDGRAAETWQRVERQLRQRGMDPEQFLAMQNKTREQLVEEARPEAELSLRRQAALEAVVEDEKLDVSEEELLEALKPGPGHEDHGHPPPEEALKTLKETGRDKLLRRDLRMRKAIDAIAEAATPIAPEAAEAKEAIWTPDKERAEKGGLWTPGSD